MRFPFSVRKNRNDAAESLEELHHELVGIVTKGPQKNSLFEDRLASRSAYRDILVKASSFSASDDTSLMPEDEDQEVPDRGSLAELEKLVAQTICSIGQTLINAPEGCMRPDCFEYFCENKVLAFLVDLALARPQSNQCVRRKDNDSSRFHPVAWSSTVKASILQTVALIISHSDAEALYFVISQNYVSKLLLSMIPLQQWTDPALDVILPAYVDLLRNAASQLQANPYLFPLYVLTRPDDTMELPILDCTLEAIQSAYAHSESFAHAACLNLLMDLMQHDQVQPYLKDDEQVALCQHFCRILLDRYERFKSLIHGPVISGARSNAIKHQISGLNDQIDLLNDAFTCGVQTLNVRLCEAILDRLVSILLDNFSPPLNRHFRAVGVLDSDVIPVSEANSQASVYFLSRMMHRLRYAPLIRMLAVILFHPQSSPLWTETRPSSAQSYPLTNGLQAIVSGTADGVPNVWRNQLVEALRGDFGEWRLVPAAILLENVITSPLMDAATLHQLTITGHYDDGWHCSLIETSIVSFLETSHVPKSDVSTMALACISTLALELYYAESARMIKTLASTSSVLEALCDYPIRKALEVARDDLYAKTIRSSETIGVAEIFLDLFEAAVKSRYKKTSQSSMRRIGTQKSQYTCNLSHYGASASAADPAALIRQQRVITLNDVERTRFFMQMAIHFRAACRILEKYENQIQRRVSTDDDSRASFCLVDSLGELIDIFGRRHSDQYGTDVDIRGRMAFRFMVQSHSLAAPDGSHDVGGDEGVSSMDGTIQHDKLVLVLDPTAILIVKPLLRHDASRCTLVCSVPLLRIIDAASDDAWLHIALKDYQDMGYLIKNGNMALHFESSGTCLIVAQYLERSRHVLRGEIVDKVKNVFAVNHDCHRGEAATVPQATNDAQF